MKGSFLPRHRAKNERSITTPFWLIMWSGMPWHWFRFM